MIIHNVEQGSDEWRKLRLGKATASSMDCIITPTGKASTQADKLMNKLIAELITGESAETFAGNVHTERGNEYEAEAVDYYSMQFGVDPEKVGFCTTDDGLLGASPDRFVGDDGMLEIKTGMPHILIEYALSGKLEQDHRPQTQCGLYVTGRKWVDTMLYNPKMKPIVIRSEVSQPYQANMVFMLNNFHQEMAKRIERLREFGYMPQEEVPVDLGLSRYLSGG